MSVGRHPHGLRHFGHHDGGSSRVSPGCWRTDFPRRGDCFLGLFDPMIGGSIMGRAGLGRALGFLGVAVVGRRLGCGAGIGIGGGDDLIGRRARWFIDRRRGSGLIGGALGARFAVVVDEAFGFVLPEEPHGVLPWVRGGLKSESWTFRCRCDGSGRNPRSADSGGTHTSPSSRCTQVREA